MDSIYNVQKRVLARAFYDWQSTLIREKGVERDRVFNESIRGVLILRGHRSLAHKLPKSKNTWNDWKRLDSSKTIALSREVCLAIKIVTGFDVTPGRILGNEFNSTDLVIIANEPTAKVISNIENHDGQEQYEVSCTRIAFRRSRTLRVKASWCEEENRKLPRKQMMREIGSAIIGLRRADIRLEANGSISPIITLISPDKNDPYARAEGVTISDDPVCAGRWMVEGRRGEGLLGSVDLNRLASAWHEPNDKMELTVEADKNDFEIDFKLQGEWPAETKRDEVVSNMRNYFIANILRLRLSKDNEAYILSRAPVKT